MASRIRSVRYVGAERPTRAAVLLSIRPRFAEGIIDGRKTVELRRRFPGSRLAGASLWIYSTSPIRAVVGKARIAAVRRLPLDAMWRAHGRDALISRRDFVAYFHGADEGFALLLDDARPLKRQWVLGELRARLGIAPPQSFKYLNAFQISVLDGPEAEFPDRHKCCDRS